MSSELQSSKSNNHKIFEISKILKAGIYRLEAKKAQVTNNHQIPLANNDFSSVHGCNINH